VYVSCTMTGFMRLTVSDLASRLLVLISAPLATSCHMHCPIGLYAYHDNRELWEVPVRYGCRMILRSPHDLLCSAP
jgi:hypothetical protein